MCLIRILCHQTNELKKTFNNNNNNGSPNISQKTRPYNSQQKKENLENCQLCSPGWPQNKTERVWKEG